MPKSLRKIKQVLALEAICSCLYKKRSVVWYGRFCTSSLRPWFNFYALRDQSIFMGIRDREICNGTTHYFGLLVERGHRLFWGLALRGHGLFQYRISTGPKIIFKYSGAGSWTISSFFWSFSYKKYGTRANLYYGTNIYFGWRFQRGRGKFSTK